ncbi:MAG: hypothetical protein NC830_07690 [Candidatus Omnitrophica bacterium]|nr:hypothetical protein [Candidatus Omnitrophota bacterium]
MKTVVLCDSSEFVSYQRFENSVLNVLDFYQILFQPIDISYTLVDAVELDDVGLMIIAQETTAKKLSSSDWRLIFKQVSAGMGLVIFDGMVSSYQELISPYIGIPEFKIEKTDEIVLEESWINSIAASKKIRTKIPLLLNTPSELDSIWNVFLRDHRFNPVGMWRKYGKGKIAIISISQGIWHKSCLGHTNGFDSVLWRTLVFTARKPFIFKAVPPFVLCRINDASGLPEIDSPAKNFGYVSVLNRADFIPHIGLCIRDIKQNSISDIRELYYQSKAEFSAHSFTKKEENRDPSIYLGSDGKEFSFEKLNSHFREIENFFCKLNIAPARTINAHRSQIGYNSIAFFKNHNQSFAMNLLKPGKTFSDGRSLSWEPKPFGVQNFCIDYLDENQAIFNAAFHPGQITNTGADIDFLNGSSERSSAISAAERGIFQIKRGLENLTCGCLMFHERNLEKLIFAEFEAVVGIINAEIRKHPHIYKPYDYVTSYLKNRMDSKIVRVQQKNAHIQVILSGKSIMPQFMYCFFDDGENTIQNFLEIPPFEKSVELSYKIPKP